MTAPTARAEVLTATPARHVKQSLSHLGRRTFCATDGDPSTAEIASGTGRVVIGGGVLTLIAEAPDSETLSRVQLVLGHHLERFAQRQELPVSWVSDATGSAGPTPAPPADHRRPDLLKLAAAHGGTASAGARPRGPPAGPGHRPKSRLSGRGQRFDSSATADSSSVPDAPPVPDSVGEPGSSS